MNKIYTILVAALLAVALIGCKKEEGDTTADVGTTAASTTGSSTTPAADGKAAAVGTWKVDPASIKGDADRGGMAKDMQFEFKDDMNFSMMIGGKEEAKGTWTIDGKSIKIAPAEVADPKDLPTLMISEDGSKMSYDDKKIQMDFKKS